MTWRQSLVRIADHEVETLRKRLADILDRRAELEMKLTMLAAESEAEMAQTDRDASLGVYRAGYLQGVKIRRGVITQALEANRFEESGARDALAVAFEALKKFEHVAELAKLEEVKQAAKIETAEMDEMGLRKRRA